MRRSRKQEFAWMPVGVVARFCGLLSLLTVAGCVASGEGNCSMPMQRGVEYSVEISTDGARITEGAVISGAREGVWRTRYRDWRLASKGLYLDDVRQNLWVEWNESGRLLSASYWLDGRIEGPSVVWDSSGAIDVDKSGLFEDGIRTEPHSERWLRETLMDVARMSETPRSR